MLRSVVFALALLLAMPVAAQHPEPITRENRKSLRLRGLKTFSVLVEHLDEIAKRTGIDETTLRVDVELLLRKANINVGSVGPRAAFVYVNVYCLDLKNTGEEFACNVSIEAYTEVTILASKQVTDAMIWSTGGMLTALDQTARERIRASVADFTNVLINDILAARTR